MIALGVALATFIPIENPASEVPALADKPTLEDLRQTWQLHVGALDSKCEVYAWKA
jgi:hypothetical protein